MVGGLWVGGLGLCCLLLILALANPQVQVLGLEVTGGRIQVFGVFRHPLPLHVVHTLLHMDHTLLHVGPHLAAGGPHLAAGGPTPCCMWTTPAILTFADLRHPNTQ